MNIKTVFAKRTEQLQNLIGEYIKLSQEIPLNDSDIIEELLDIFEEEDLIELGFYDFMENYIKGTDD